MRNRHNDMKEVHKDGVQTGKKGYNSFLLLVAGLGGLLPAGDERQDARRNRGAFRGQNILKRRHTKTNMKTLYPAALGMILLCATIMPVVGSEPALIPQPQNLVRLDGMFRLAPDIWIPAVI